MQSPQIKFSPQALSEAFGEALKNESIDSLKSRIKSIKGSQFPFYAHFDIKNVHLINMFAAFGHKISRSLFTQKRSSKYKVNFNFQELFLLARIEKAFLNEVRTVIRNSKIKENEER